MVTFQAGRVALVMILVSLAAACSREQQDWRSAESADTSESWGRFIEQHPDSELLMQARARIALLTQQRAWQHAESIGTQEAYQQFLVHYPAGKWSEEARIRIEGFSLGSAPRTTLPTPEEAAAIDASARVRALHLASAAVAAPAAPEGDVTTPTGAAVVPAAASPVRADGSDHTLAEPGEAAQAVSDDTALAIPPVPQSRSSSADGSSPASGYGVQLGAFISEASADREWRRLQGRFSSELRGLSPRIVAASSDSGQLYRLQAPAGGEAQARAICASLREQEQPCMTVLPR